MRKKTKITIDPKYDFSGAFCVLYYIRNNLVSI